LDVGRLKMESGRNLAFWWNFRNTIIFNLK